MDNYSPESPSAQEFNDYMVFVKYHLVTRSVSGMFMIIFEKAFPAQIMQLKATIIECLPSFLLILTSMNSFVA